MADDIQFHRDEEWTAVYLNGKLERVGDNYLADEWLQSYVGVKVIDDDAFMLGGNQYEDVAGSLDRIEIYKTERSERLERATALRKQSEDLMRQAQQLEAM